ncbi:MAG: hypothetical protein ACJAQZ_004299, partial [Planctomycetota bacterium]
SRVFARSPIARLCAFSYRASLRVLLSRAIARVKTRPEPATLNFRVLLKQL